MNSTKICEQCFILSNLSSEQLSKYYDIAIKASKIGGDILLANYGKLKEVSSKSTIGDLVTNADIESEKKIIEYLSEVTPFISILAEETGDKGEDNDLKWMIDPLDGTTNFAHGYPFFATSIGLTFQGIPLLGSINIPFIREIYSAAPGIGSFCNNQKIQVSKSSKLIESLLVTGFAYDRQVVLDNNYAEFCWLTHRTRGVRRGGAAAVDLAFVASGRLDGYWERGLAKWDLAAGVPIVELAGGVVSDYRKKEFNLESGRILACTPLIEKEIKIELGKVKPLGKEQYGGRMG